MPATARRIDPLRSLFEYTVEGRGEFPVDMLRYDQCWPKRESEDVHALYASVRGFRATEDEKGRRRVTLVGTHSPTVDRWASFGWKVL